jgi:prepilin-type N-terminal cleavage/methylation domain-containing protein
MKKKEQGFSLIEILVVVGIISVIGGITSTIFIQIIKANNKGNVITEVKQNGDLALNKIERIVRNAEEVSAFGKKSTYSDVWTWELPADALEHTCTVPAVPADKTLPVEGGLCALIVKNPASEGGYTQIELNTERDRDCAGTPFTTADQDSDSIGTYCNGNIRIVTDNTASSPDTLKLDDPRGLVITNTEKRSGVSVRPTGTNPIISMRTAAGKPPLVTFNFTLVQGIGASSRYDSLAEVPFDLTISLRSY